jgi:tRNA(Arg) A34 adenosine deaminase TadA
MCFSACHWAKISRIVWGVKLEDSKSIGFRELVISNEKMRQLGKTRVEIVEGFLWNENLEIFKLWSRQRDRKTY